MSSGDSFNHLWIKYKNHIINALKLRKYKKLLL
jgi:hypothetical protein